MLLTNTSDQDVVLLQRHVGYMCTNPAEQPVMSSAESSKMIYNQFSAQENNRTAVLKLHKQHLNYIQVWNNINSRQEWHSGCSVATAHSSIEFCITVILIVLFNVFVVGKATTIPLDYDKKLALIANTDAFTEIFRNVHCPGSNRY